MPDEDLIDLAARIYSRHRRALDFIFENRLDELAKLTEGVDRRMREASTSIGIAPLNMHKGYVRFLPSKWDTPNNRAGAAWGAGGSAYVICELNLWNKQPTVKIVEGSAPAAWREQLFVLAKSPPLRAAAKMSAQWMSIYRGKLPKLNPDVDPDEAAEAVWKACAEHVTNDPGFDAAVDIVAKHVALLPSP